MKTFRLFLGAIAFVFAFATAFAFRAAVVQPSYIHPDTGACTNVSISCSGDAITCNKDLGSPLGFKNIHDNQPSSCVVLKMAN